MNDELKAYFQRIVNATNALCGTSFEKFVPKDIHDALLNHTGFERENPPTTFGGYMVGIAVCARHIGGKIVYMTGKSGLAKICEYLENPKFKGECPHCGGILTWTEDDIDEFTKDCPYCNGEYMLNSDGSITPERGPVEMEPCGLCGGEFRADEFEYHMKEAHWQCPYCDTWFETYDENHEDVCYNDWINS